MAKSRQPKNPAFPLSESDASKLIDGLFRHGKYKHAAYVKLSISFGLRFSDTSQITWGEILDSRTNVFSTTETKTSKPARRGIHPELKEFIESCWQGLKCPDKNQAILINAQRTKISSIQSMNMICQKRWIDLYDLNIDKVNFSQHSFRKTSAMIVYNKKGIVMAQNWLNHADSKETARYLLINELDIIDFNVF